MYAPAFVLFSKLCVCFISWLVCCVWLCQAVKCVWAINTLLKVYRYSMICQESRYTPWGTTFFYFNLWNNTTHKQSEWVVPVVLGNSDRSDDDDVRIFILSRFRFPAENTHRIIVLLAVLRCMELSTSRAWDRSSSSSVVLAKKKLALIFFLIVRGGQCVKHRRKKGEKTQNTLLSLRWPMIRTLRRRQATDCCCYCCVWYVLV